MKIAAVVFSTLLFFFAAGAGLAKEKPNKQRRGKGRAGAVHGQRFQAHEIDIIFDYYQGGGGSLPPGLAKKSSLPPGLEKQLRRNGRLPPGLQKKIAPFPAALEQRLPALPAGYRRAMVDRWALLIHDATNVVFDIIDLTRR